MPLRRDFIGSSYPCAYQIGATFQFTKATGMLSRLVLKNEMSTKIVRTSATKALGFYFLAPVSQAECAVWLHKYATESCQVPQL